MRWIELTCPEGSLYVDISMVSAIGPSMADSIGGRTIAMRLLYLQGGQGVAILDTPENMQKLFQTNGGRAH